MEHCLAILGAVSSKFAMLALLIIGHRIMPAEEFGIFSLLVIVAGMIMAIVSGGGDMWLNRFTRLSRVRSGKAPAISGVYMRISFLIGSAFLAICPIIAMLPFWQDNHGAFIAAIIYAVIHGWTETLLAIIRSCDQVKKFFLWRDLAPTLALLSLVMMLKPTTATGMFVIYSIIMLGLFVYLYFLCGKFLASSRPRKGIINIQAISYTGKLVMNNLSSRLVGSVDSFILTAFLSLPVIGHYRLLTQIAIGFTVVQHFAFLALPWQLHTIGARQDQGNNQAKQRQWLLILVSAPPLIILLLTSEFLLSFINPELVQLIKVFYIAITVRFTEILWGPLHEVLITNNKTQVDTLGNVLGVITWGILFVLSLSLLYINVFESALIAMIGASFMVHIFKFLQIRFADIPLASVLPTPLIIVVYLALLGYTTLS